MPRVCFLLLAAALAGCPPVSVDDDDSADSGPDDPILDALTATCGPELTDGARTLPVEALDGSFACDMVGCALALPDSAPTRSYATLRASDTALAVFGWESDEIIVGRPGGVERLSAPAWSFAVTDESLWVVVDDEIIEVLPGGSVRRACPLPTGISAEYPVVDVEAGTLLVSGYSEVEERGQLHRATPDGWELLSTGVWPDRVVHHQGDDLIVLAYGYYEVLSLDTLEVQQLGGSDDDFSDVVVCDDASYWVGGMTGLNLYCAANHECSDRLDGFPFQSASTRCNEDRDLEYLLENQGVVTFHTLTAKNEQREEPAPAGLRHFTSRGDRTWRVVDAD